MVELIPRWTALYTSDKLDPPVEVRLRSLDKPTKHRTFRTARGRVRFTLQELHRITTTTKEKATMARGKKTATIDDELEELEAAFDEDELEDLEDVEEDDEEEVEEVKPKRSRAKRGTAAKTKAERAKERRQARAAKAAEAEDEDEEDDEEEAEEKPARKRTSKTAAKKGTAKKGASKSTAKKSGNGKVPPALVRELPAGKLGATEIAKLAKTDARAVRVFLRKNKERYPRNEELGRYAFTKKQAQQIAKAINAA